MSKFDWWLHNSLRKLNKAYGVRPHGIEDTNCTICRCVMVVLPKNAVIKTEVLRWSGQGFQCVACGRYVCDLCRELNRENNRENCQCGHTQWNQRTFLSNSNAVRFDLI
jgi:hypothetical protein